MNFVSYGWTRSTIPILYTWIGPTRNKASKMIFYHIKRHIKIRPYSEMTIETVISETLEKVSVSTTFARFQLFSVSTSFKFVGLKECCCWDYKIHSLLSIIWKSKSIFSPKIPQIIMKFTKITLCIERFSVESKSHLKASTFL